MAVVAAGDTHIDKESLSNSVGNKRTSEDEKSGGGVLSLNVGDVGHGSRNA